MYNGILNIRKEKGFTSHDVVAKLRGIVGQKKIGHTGTLDPDATGVLPVCLGKATKVCDQLTDTSKEYITTLLLGTTTTTQDTSGAIIKHMDPSGLTEEQVRSVIKTFVGEQDQIPPMYSAIKVGGKKLYELARQGLEIERKARRVQFYSIDVLSIEFPRVQLQVHCSKGTYIRTLCHDIGELLGCGGCMEELVRTRVSIFDLDSSVTLQEVEAAKHDAEEDTFAQLLTPIDVIFMDCAKYLVKPEYRTLAVNGSVLHMEQVTSVDPLQRVSDSVLLYLENQQLLGLYLCDEKGKLRCTKFFYDPT